MSEQKRINKKKDYFIMLIILFFITLSQTNQHSAQTKETNEPKEAFDGRDIDYKEDKDVIKYDKEFDYMDKKFNDATLNFFDINNLEALKISFNPIFQKNPNKKEKLNKNLNKIKLRNLQNSNNYIIVKVSGNNGEPAQVINGNFSP